MVKYITLLLVILASCTPQKRIARICEMNPSVCNDAIEMTVQIDTLINITSDTIIYRDTIFKVVFKPVLDTLRLLRVRSDQEVYLPLAILRLLPSHLMQCIFLATLLIV